MSARARGDRALSLGPRLLSYHDLPTSESEEPLLRAFSNRVENTREQF